MSSSSSSQHHEPGSSDSLDTTLGLGTEISRSTLASPTSSSTPGLSDPTLASLDSSRPKSPPLTGSFQPRPPPSPPPPLPQCRELFKQSHLLKKNRRKTSNFLAKKRAKEEIFNKKKGRFQDFLFHFFLVVFTVLLYLHVHL